jgi:hypothetical protein
MSFIGTLLIDFERLIVNRNIWNMRFEGDTRSFLSEFFEYIKNEPHAMRVCQLLIHFQYFIECIIVVDPILLKSMLVEMDTIVGMMHYFYDRHFCNNIGRILRVPGTIPLFTGCISIPICELLITLFSPRVYREKYLFQIISNVLFNKILYNIDDDLDTCESLTNRLHEHSTSEFYKETLATLTQYAEYMSRDLILYALSTLEELPDYCYAVPVHRETIMPGIIQICGSLSYTERKKYIIEICLENMVSLESMLSLLAACEMMVFPSEVIRILTFTVTAMKPDETFYKMQYLRHIESQIIWYIQPLIVIGNERIRKFKYVGVTQVTDFWRRFSVNIDKLLYHANYMNLHGSVFKSSAETIYSYADRIQSIMKCDPYIHSLCVEIVPNFLDDYTHVQFKYFDLLQILARNGYAFGFYQNTIESLPTAESIVSTITHIQKSMSYMRFRLYPYLTKMMNTDTLFLKYVANADFAKHSGQDEIVGRYTVTQSAKTLKLYFGPSHQKLMVAFQDERTITICEERQVDESMFCEKIEHLDEFMSHDIAVDYLLYALKNAVWSGINTDILIVILGYLSPMQYTLSHFKSLMNLYAITL